MKKQLLFLLTMLAVLVVSGEAKSFTFKDNFEDGNTKGWMFVSDDERSSDPASCWKVENGRLLESCPWDAQLALVANRSFTSHTFKTQVEVLGSAGVVLWYRDLNNYVAIGMYGGGSAIYVNEACDGITYSSIYGHDNYQSGTLDMEVKADSVNGKFDFYFGGQYAFTHTVQTSERKGLSGLAGGNNGGYFDNFSISSISDGKNKK